MPDSLTPSWVSFRARIAQNWAVSRYSITTIPWTSFRAQILTWSIFRVQVTQPWIGFRASVEQSILFRASIKLDKPGILLEFRLYPLEDAVKLTYPDKLDIPNNTILSVYDPTGKSVLTGYIDSVVLEWLFISTRDGVYRVLLQDSELNTLADQSILVNNRTILFIENLRREDKDDCTLAQYELVLALNYTALDNWRIGDYNASTTIYEWLHDYTKERNVLS